MGDDYRIWIGDDPAEPVPDPSVPSPSPGRPRWMRWLVLGVGMVVIAALVVALRVSGRDDRTAVGPERTVAEESVSKSAISPDVVTTGERPSMTSPATATRPAGPTAPPRTSRTAAAPVSADAGTALSGDLRWELVGFAPGHGSSGGGAAVVRYRPATGQMVSTAVPQLMSSGPMTFAIARDTAFVLPLDYVSGYAVTDGEPAVEIAADPQFGYGVFPGPDPDHLWRTAEVDYGELTVTLIDVHGKPAGDAIPVPSMLAWSGSWSLLSDGAGNLIGQGVGGVYLLTPDGTTLITHGALLASGPGAFLVFECDERAACALVAIDRSTGERTLLPHHESTPPLYGPGITSHDGRWAALVDNSNGPSVRLLDLWDGTEHRVSAEPTDGIFGMDARNTLAFTPDDRYLLVNATHGVIPVDLADGTALPVLPVPPLRAFALRADR